LLKALCGAICIQCAALLILLQPNQSLAGSQTIRVGSLGGPNAKIMQAAKAAAARDGVNIEIVEFNDPRQVAQALDAKSIDAAELPNTLFLEQYVGENGQTLAVATYTVTFPMGIYSKTLGSLKELKQGDSIAVPDDPINGPRALILLHNCGLLGLTDGAGLHAATSDITDNPKELKIIELPSDKLAGVLPSVAAAAMPFPDAAYAGFEPARDAIMTEDGHSPYAGILVTRNEDANAPWVASLIAAVHSSDVKTFLLTQYNGSVRRPW